MDKVIDKGSVAVVNTTTHLQQGVAHLCVQVQHTLDTPQAEVLIGLVERLAIKAVEAWAGV